MESSKKAKDDNSRSGKQGKVSFPERLMALIEEQVAPDAIWFLPGNRVFVIEQKRFTAEVLDKYFQGTKFMSFVRQLNRLGFRRISRSSVDVPKGSVVFVHSLFRKGHPEMVKTIVDRKRDEKSLKAQQAKEAAEAAAKRRKTLLVQCNQEQPPSPDIALSGHSDTKPPAKKFMKPSPSAVHQVERKRAAVPAQQVSWASAVPTQPAYIHRSPSVSVSSASSGSTAQNSAQAPNASTTTNNAVPAYATGTSSAQNPGQAPSNTNTTTDSLPFDVSSLSQNDLVELLKLLRSTPYDVSKLTPQDWKDLIQLLKSSTTAQSPAPPVPQPQPVQRPQLVRPPQPPAPSNNPPTAESFVASLMVLIAGCKKS
ncbi:shock factor protein 2 [Seminavis robusta]|uniref:Shock factor protein 2 n=1 Tax=Seminavis robusta TaxID=568900 RepID=A0A9N8EDF7_9STRA|nr:shock factor protein 2 [Seminavis robusta]|eukprot:Sro781_g201670.1 shock factor protein 2 (368) ;mRNA; r:43840-45032